MSYPTESDRHKQKHRQDLREERNRLLETVKAKRHAQESVPRQVEKELDFSMLKKPKKKRSSKKSSNKSRKKKKRYSSSSSASSSDSEDSSDSSSSDSEDSSSSSSSSDGEKRKSRKHRKKTKKVKKSKRRRTKHDDSEDECAPKKNEESKEDELAKKSEPIARDSWMTDSSAMSLKTFQRERVEKKPNDKQQIDSYDPAISSRELNPYWKLTGTGLPSFKKPKEDDDDDDAGHRKGHTTTQLSNKSWQKKPMQEEKLYRASSSSSSTPSKKASETAEPSVQSKPASTEFLTDAQMNALAAKILKAEIMGDTQKVAALTEQLEKARKVQGSVKQTKEKKHEEEEEHILLTHTDERGHTRPLAKARTPMDPRDLYGGRKGGKQRSKRVETHENGERVRFFADDDRFDIKQMFEREKYTNSADSNLEFAKIAGQHKNPNDDLEDIFADTVRKSTNDEQIDKRATQQAINEHQRLASQLENCDKCIDSSKMDRKRIVCMGEKFYLALPWHEGLVYGHCLLVPTQHVSCCTQLDEDAWEELNNFRKAMTRMFADNHKDVIFYEIANHLKRRPHLEIHCIPIGQRDGENAPFYFKKAIEESEQEWSVNKQLIQLKGKSLTSAIPREMSYVWVNFGMDRGFAHVIEDANRFPANFAQEIIGGMLELNPQKWRKPRKETDLIRKVNVFGDMWKKYNPTT